jgi:GntR family transcriptional regulator
MLGEKLYRISRLRILEQLPLMIETAYIPVALAPGLEEQDLVTESLFRILKSIYGLSLDHGVEKTGITLVSEEEAQYLQLTAGDAAFWIESRTEASDGTVVEYCRTVGRADRIEMVSTLRWADAKEPRT